MAKLILSELAEEDVDVIHAYICAENPEAADRVQEAIFEGFDLLSRNPRLGAGAAVPPPEKSSLLGRH